MNAAQNATRLTVEEYLDGEKHAEVRHEYMGGAVYAMSGGSVEHNAISLNVTSALHAHLKGKGCRVFAHDVKVRLEIAGDDIFYYPDVLVSCDPRDTDPFFRRYPKVIFEVLSDSTERFDRREKYLSYIQIETLEEYVILSQDKMEATLFQRSALWQPQVMQLPDDQLAIKSLDFSLKLSAIYDGIRL